MEIIQTEKVKDSENEFITGWLSDQDGYRKFIIYPNNNLSFVDYIPKNEFESYKHFIGVMSKFNPHAFFLEKPLKIKIMDWILINNLIKK